MIFAQRTGANPNALEIFGGLVSPKSVVYSRAALERAKSNLALEVSICGPTISVGRFCCEQNDSRFFKEYP